MFVRCAIKMYNFYCAVLLLITVRYARTYIIYYTCTSEVRPVTIPLIPWYHLVLWVVTGPVRRRMERDVCAMHKQVKAEVVLTFEHFVVQNLTKDFFNSASESNEKWGIAGYLGSISHCRVG